MRVPDSKYNLWLFAGVLLVCFLFSAGIRYQQYKIWQKTPSNYFVGERPMMTTLDAPFWLRVAREYNEGIFKKEDNLRAYPKYSQLLNKKLVEEFPIPQKYKDSIPNAFPLSNNPDLSIEDSSVSFLEIPLLSYFLAKLAPLYDYNYFLTGTIMIPVLASFFILPLGMFFFRIGIPLSGLMGGLIGTFAGSYYMRTSIGRIDTDLLNLFFPTLTALLILLALQTKSMRVCLLLSSGAGLSLFLFHWWYGKAGFTMIYFLVIVFSLFIHQKNFLTILISVWLFLFFSNPGIFFEGTNDIRNFLGHYFVIEESMESISEKNINQATFPNTFSTISEAEKTPMDEVLRRIIFNPIISWAGLIAIFILVVFRWRVLLLLSPILLLGLMGFQSSNRFIMYLAPFVGIGLGWLLSLVIEVFFDYVQRKNIEKNEKNHLESISATNTNKRDKFKREKLNIKESIWTSIFNYAANLTGIQDDDVLSLKSTKGSKKISFRVTEGKGNNFFYWTRQGVLYLGMGGFFWLISGQTAISFVPGPSIHPRVYSTFLELKKLVSDKSALLTWWDYGYAITDATGLATFHDGGTQISPKTYFIARGLVSTNQDELHDIIQFLATEGNNGIAKNNTSPESLLEAIRNPDQEPWDQIFLFFTADMTGKFGAISKLGSWDMVKGGSQPRVYQNLSCNKFTNKEMNCRGAKIDLNAGFINNQLALRRMVFIRNGQLISEKKFRHSQGFTLQLIVAGKNIIEVQLIDEQVFHSNYNQMFLLGRHRKDLFEETYNAFPFSRLFRIKF